MRIKNTKIRLRYNPSALPRLNLNNLLFAGEWFSWLMAIIFILFADDELQLLNNWIMFMVVILVLRLGKFLLFGNKAFPGVDFDLGLLIAVTALLMVTIIQTNGKDYSSLGGVSTVGIGVTILSALTLYLLATAYKSYNAKWSWHILFGIITAKLLATIFWGDTNIATGRVLVTLDIAIIALVFIPLSIANMGYFKNVYVKLVSFISLLAGVYLVLVAADWALALLIGLALVTFALFSLITERAQSLKKLNLLSWDRKEIVSKVLETIGFWSLLAGLASLGVAAGGYFTDDEFKLSLDALYDSYMQIDNYFSVAKEWLTGYGLISFNTQLGSTLIAYGIVGSIVLVLFYVLLLLTTYKQLRKNLTGKNNREKLWLMAIFSSLFFFIAATFIAGVNLLVAFVAITIISYLFGFASEQKNPIKSDDFIDYKTVASSKLLTRILPAQNWALIFNYLRVVLIIGLVIMIPNMVEFLQGLF